MTNELNLSDPHKRWRLTVSPERGITTLGLDSESGDRAETNLLLQPANVLVGGRPLAPRRWELSERGAEATLAVPDSKNSLRWRVRSEEDGFAFELAFEGDSLNEEVRLSLPMDALRVAATLIPSDLDRDNLGVGPWLLVAPDFGHLLVSAESHYAWRGVNDGKRGSLSSSGLRGIDPSLRGVDILRAGGVDLSQYKPGEIRLQFLCREPMRAGTILTLRFRAVPLTTPDGIDAVTWKRIRRPYLNHWQPCSTWDDRSRWNVLANNVLSDPASCSLPSYSEPMLFWREPVPGLDVTKLLRHSVNYWLDHHVSYFGHVNAFDMGRWKRFDLYLFANPMLVTSAWHYWKLTGDKAWLASRIKLLHRIGEFIARRDVDGDGLVESIQSGNAGTLRQPDRADVWFEMTNFGWKNPYTNALTYRAWRQLAELLDAAGHPGGAARFRQLAEKLKQAYVARLISRDHGWVVSWISADGEVHDYGHIFTSGMAVAYGIIPPEQGRQVLQRVVDKSHQIGFRAWHLGVPANLIPVKRADMILPMIGLDGAPWKEPHPLWNWPEDLSDEQTFGRRYTNGTVHPPLVWPYLLGLQTAGLHDEANRILEAMIGSAEKGLLQNGIIGCMPLGADHFCQDGTTCGFEGYLPESFNVLMACFTRDADNRRRLRAGD